MRPNPLLLRALVLLTVGGSIAVASALGGTFGFGPTLVVSFAVIGFLLHVVAGWVFDRDGRLPLARAGVAYPVLSGIVGTVYVWRNVSVVLGVLCAVGVVALLVAAGTVGRSDLRSGPIGPPSRPERIALAERTGWRFVENGDPELRTRWPGGRSPRTTAVLAADVGGLPVTVFDTMQRLEGPGYQRVTTWLVHLPVDLPVSTVVPWVAGDGPAPATEAELLALADEDPDVVLAAGMTVDVLRKAPVWEPVIHDPGPIGEHHLLADSDDRPSGGRC